MRNKDLDKVLEAFVMESVKEATATKRQQLSGEDFSGWLPVTINNDVMFNITLSQLKSIRDAARNISITSEIFKNVIKHYQNKVIGSGLSVNIYREDLGEDPAMLASSSQDSTVKTMLENWKAFTASNKFNAKLRDWVKRRKRDGEVFIRIFKGEVPQIRFVDPGLVESDNQDAPWGVLYDKNDMETPKTYFIKDLVTSKYASVKAELMLHHKDDADTDWPRAIPSVYPVITNIRRVDKLLVNISAVAQVQSAIALIRRHKGANQAKVNSFLNKSSTGTNTNVLGGSTRTRMLEPGTILDAPESVEYDFPSHEINVANLGEVIKYDLARISNNYVLPIEWLLGEEPKEPLNAGSPVVANFETEQSDMYEKVEELFWMIQQMMGVNIEDAKLKYNIFITGPRLSVAKALDEARIDEIYQRLGATSPQEIAAKIGNNWVISRANTIKHRNTAQPNEQMPGDSGNTNTGGGDGLSKSGGGQRGSDAAGGNNNV